MDDGCRGRHLNLPNVGPAAETVSAERHRFTNRLGIRLRGNTRRHQDTADSATERGSEWRCSDVQRKRRKSIVQQQQRTRPRTPQGNLIFAIQIRDRSGTFDCDRLEQA